MTDPRAGWSRQAQQFTGMLDRFTQETAGVIAAITVSSDGLPIALSTGIKGFNVERVGALASMAVSLAGGMADCHPLGNPDNVVIELTHGYLLVRTISVGCALGVVARKPAALDAIADEMAVFADRAFGALSPQIVNELKRSIWT